MTVLTKPGAIKKGCDYTLIIRPIMGPPRELFLLKKIKLSERKDLWCERIYVLVREKWKKKITGFVPRTYFPMCCAASSQAWRRYDTDRSGYIEANELKVKTRFTHKLYTDSQHQFSSNVSFKCYKYLQSITMK